MTAPASRDDAISAVEGEFATMANRIRAQFAQRAERLSPGLLPGAYKVFSVITAHGPITAKEVTSQLLIDKSQLSRTIAALEERGLITRTRDPKDRRAQLLEATPYGRERLEHARHDPAERNLRSRLADWDTADVDRLARMLRALNEAN